MTTYLKEKTETMVELICRTHPDPFNQSQAILFGLTAEDLVMGCESHGDVYDLLSTYESTKLAQESDYLILSTCGWAKPISDDEEDDEIAPSQHPARRRVLVVLGFDSKGNWSIARFADSNENVVSESVRGALADAVKDLMDRANAKGN